MKTILFASALVAVISACGQKEEKRDLIGSLTSASLQDSAVQGEIASALASEALSSASAGESTATAMSLDESSEPDPLKSVKRTCTAENGVVTVKIASEMEHSFTKENGARTMTISHSGSGEQTRIWSKEGATLTCSSDKFKLEGNMQQGLKLQLSVSREREMKRSFTNKNGKTMSMSKSFSMKATRTVEWLDVSNQTGDGLLRKKKISNSEATRSMKMENSKGKSIETSLKVTIGEAGLLVWVKRSSESKELTQKLIESGDVVATLKDGAVVTTSYNNLLFTVDEGKCSMASGSFSMSIKDKAGADGGTITCKADGEISEEGNLQCTNAAGETVEVEAPLCDPEDAA